MRGALAVVGALLCLVVVSWWHREPRIHADQELPPLASRVAADPSAPDVVLVLACTLRRDQLSPYGGPAEASPFLAQLARRGVRFDDLIAASSWTKASSTALLTGHHALSVAMVEPGPHRNELALDRRVTTLAERLAGLGYETLGVTGNPNLDWAFGLAQGFDRYGDSGGRIRDGKPSGHDLVDRALALVDDREAPDRPLFLQLMLVDPHSPRAATHAEQARFPGLDEEVATYLAEVRRLDDALARLEAELASRGIRDPLFVVVADHGEGLERVSSLYGHGRILNEFLTRVPWIVSGPGVASGHVVDGVASGIDLVPTLLGLVGAPAADLPGRDWSGLVRGGGARTDLREAFADTWFYGVRRSAIFTSGYACQEDFGSEPDSGELRAGCFNRWLDPGWERPRSRPQHVEALHAWRAERLIEGAAFGDGTRATLDEEMRTSLEALGYVE